MEFTVLETFWLRASLDAQIAILERKLRAETNPDIRTIREREISEVRDLRSRL